ncbi:MAG: hypothetical protein A3H35_14390 [Betaproteobacteria bacterium RIFCSPLOWO2_02_FULL_62_17]|nr:MAG: hypothetical protein A3H35_14390 [Betaproteobacteria bacterium RIFCSPLOWO2_02_FULL_62_17]
MTTQTAKYEQLIQDLRVQLRPQREWGEGRGLFLVIGHFLNGIAGGAWLMSLVFDSVAGLAVGFVMAALGGTAHLCFLGRPERFWRMVWRMKSSWISRGFLGLSLFLTGAFLYLVPLFLPGAPWNAGSLLGQTGYVLAFAGMIILIGYMGFVYTASKAIPFWNSPLHPVLYIGHALRGGVAALLVVAAFGAPSAAPEQQLLWMWIAVTSAVALLFAIEMHGAFTSGNVAARGSVHKLLAGSMAWYFYIGTLAVGVAVPAWLVLAGWHSVHSRDVMALIGIASAIGDFFMKYSVIRAGTHLPLWIPAAPRR